MSMEKKVIKQEEVKDNFLLNEEIEDSQSNDIEEFDPDAPYMYLKKNVPGYYAEMPEKLKEEDFDNLGETYEDFLLNKWILLSDEQVQFHLDNPNASVQEVISMKINLDQLILKAKQKKLSELSVYDNSSEVNEFSINGILKTWFTPEQRANYKNSIDSAKLLGISTLLLLVEGQIIEIPTDKAAQLLAMIQLYADSCYIVTKQHEGAIQALETIEDILNYDYKVGYPKKLNFEL